MTTSAAILCIGDELALGESLDTNSAWIAARLAECGAVAREHRTVGDDRGAISAAVTELAGRCDVLVISGGLGPTGDDVTREALGDVLDPGRPLVEDTAAWDRLRARFERRGLEVPLSNRRQLCRPASMRLLGDRHGTAPGLTGALGACTIFALPGPPRELKPMFEQHVAAPLAAGCGLAAPTALVHQFGLPEAAAAERLGSLVTGGGPPNVGVTASAGVITARVRGAIGGEEEVSRLVEHIETEWAPYCFGTGDETLASHLGRRLMETGGKLVTAESCTGGLVSKLIVDVPGSSEYFIGEWVTYSNVMKERVLDVPPDLIAAHGAVSEPVARAMASGAIARCDDLGGADVSCAITGVAGPDGGSDDKPVGTVFIAVARRAAGVHVRRFRFRGDRETVRRPLGEVHMQMVRFVLDGVGPESILLGESGAAAGRTT